MDKLNVRLDEKKCTLSIYFSYSDLLNVISNKNISTIFSTYQYRNQNGYIKCTPLNFFVLLEISRDSKVNNTYGERDYIKLSANPRKKRIQWTINLNYAYHLVGQQICNQRMSFNSPELDNHFFNLIVLNEKQMYSSSLTTTNNNEKSKINDFKNADQYRYDISPNTDSNRSFREYLGGSGSNMSRRRF